MCALKKGVQARISCFKYLPRLCKIGGTSLVLSGYISLFPIFYLEIKKKDFACKFTLWFTTFVHILNR